VKEYEYDVVALGGGTGGLVTAAGAAYLGAHPALLEKDALGGDCLWTGCVPSKALLASARLAHAMRNAEELGLKGASPGHAFNEVMERMRTARETVAHHDDPQRFRDMGVDVHFGTGRFLEPGVLEVEGVGRIRSSRIVIATGAVPAIPPIPGLEDAGYLTHETAFDQDELPERIVILGGGPIGLEFSQIYARLGAEVTVLEMLPEILPAEDDDVGVAVREILEEEGIRFVTGAKASRVYGGSDASTTAEEGGSSPPGGRDDAPITVETEDGRRFGCHAVFVATGRTPRTETLELERAGIETDGAAIRVDDTLKTTGRGAWAVGDVTGGLQFTHVADYMAKTALRNCIFPFSSRVDYSSVPWVTYTDPEVAHIGLGQEEAEARGGTTYRYDLADLDRAIVDARTRGFSKITADRKGKILGATVVAHDAGNLLQPIVLAKKHGLKLSDVSDTVFPYPTMVEGVKRTADAYQRSRLEGTGGKLLKKVVSWLT